MKTSLSSFIAVRSCILAALLGVGTSFWLPCAAHAANYNWQGGGSTNDWNVAANWGGSAPPRDGTADLFFGASSFIYPNLDASYAVNSLHFGSLFSPSVGDYIISGTGSSTLTLGAGGLTIYSYKTGGTTETIGTAFQLGSDQTWQFAGTTASTVTLGAGLNTAGHTLSLQTQAPATTINGVISGSGGLTNSQGITVLTGASTYTGATRITGGTLRFNNANALSTTSAVVLGSSQGGAGELAVGVSTTINKSFTVMGTGTFSAAPGTKCTIEGGLDILDGAVLGFGSSDHTGTVTTDLTTVSTRGTFQISIKGGTVQNSFTFSALSSLSAALTVASGATCNLLEGLDFYARDLGGAGSITSPTRAKLIVATGNFSGSIGGAVVLQKNMAGTLILTGTNTYTGGTNVDVGALVELNNGHGLGTGGTATIASGAILALSNTGTGDVYQAPVTFVGAGTLQKLGMGTVRLGGNGGNITVSLGKGGLIDVEAGTLRGSSSNQGFYANNVGDLYIASGATFNGVEASVVVGALNGAGTLLGGYNGVVTTTVGAAGADGTFAGVIADSGEGESTDSGMVPGTLALVKLGGGTQTLTGTNTYTGGTTISQGSLQIGNGGTSGTLGSGVVVNNSALVFNRSDRVNVPNAISGSGTLTKISGGTLVLSGANTYSGATNVNAGTLLFNGSNSGTGTVTVSGSGSGLGGSGSTAGAVRVTGSGTLNPGNNIGVGGAGSTVGTLTVGALTLDSTASVVFDLNSGSIYDRLVANGDIALGGSTLTLNVNSSTTAYSVGQVLDLFHNNSGTLSGTFSNFANNGFYTYGSDTFRANYTATDFTLTVTAVPEPATWASGALLLAGTGWVLRRRRRQA